MYHLGFKLIKNTIYTMIYTYNIMPVKIIKKILFTIHIIIFLCFLNSCASQSPNNTKSQNQDVENQQDNYQNLDDLGRIQDVRTKSKKTFSKLDLNESTQQEQQQDQQASNASDIKKSNTKKSQNNIKKPKKKSSKKPIYKKIILNNQNFTIKSNVLYMCKKATRVYIINEPGVKNPNNVCELHAFKTKFFVIWETKNRRFMNEFFYEYSQKTLKTCVKLLRKIIINYGDCYESEK